MRKNPNDLKIKVRNLSCENILFRISGDKELGLKIYKFEINRFKNYLNLKS